MGVSICTSFLSLIVVVQFIVIMKLLSSHHHSLDSNSFLDSNVQDLGKLPIQSRSNSLIHPDLTLITDSTLPKTIPQLPSKTLQILEGVAVTTMLHAPTWYQRRYTLMIQNTISNLPPNWKIQIFYTGKGQSQAGLDISPGIHRFIESGDVILTLMPAEIQKIKRYQLMFNRWFWENMLADKVLMFGGGSVICSNSPLSIKNFIQYDYIGAPWHFYDGRGGDGIISIRNRKHMIAAMDYALSKVKDPAKKHDAYLSWGQEDHFYVQTLMEMNSLGLIRSEIATKEATYQFAASNNWANDSVWVASGTLPDVHYSIRDKFLQFCPELKMVYPSLHDPNCFGATPNGEECAKSVCALRSKQDRKGGC